MFDENLMPFLANLNPTVMWIALTVGLLLFVIGYFAGAKLTLGRIGMCVLLTTLLGALSLSAPIRLFSLVSRGLNVKTTLVENNDTKSKSKTPAKANAENAASLAPDDSTSTGVESKVPISLQLMALAMYLLWSAFLVAMGIFLYETLTVTAEEAEKR